MESGEDAQLKQTLVEYTGVVRYNRRMSAENPYASPTPQVTEEGTTSLVKGAVHGAISTAKWTAVVTTLMSVLWMLFVVGLYVYVWFRYERWMLDEDGGWSAVGEAVFRVVAFIATACFYLAIIGAMFGVLGVLRRRRRIGLDDATADGGTSEVLDAEVI